MEKIREKAIKCDCGTFGTKLKETNRWREYDITEVKCPYCKTWEKNIGVYKTGDIMGCPVCEKRFILGKR